ncbi:hypothetical protein [Nocardia sienata]|uniref:hypothetical protein n=1 Tax=Nocardia sienata TaxID=248552 RepID=UPI0012ED58FE|nr:hypothetical protein [Nocardia sienata]
MSTGMLDAVDCDAKRPPRWRPSIAVFRYDPADDYQPFEDRSISYLKVVVSVAPFAPEIDSKQLGSYLPPVLIDDVEESFPCYGALLQVTVAPTPADRENFLVQHFPYFVDFEPKKRELYEAVTDTGERLSGSTTHLTVGKSAQQTDTTENYNLDTGWNFSVSGLEVGETGQQGAVDRSSLQTTNLRTTDESTERRERESHTTQLAQMYNLFQAFHVGTNRALFLMEPRPHIRQGPATFINGPRALEGIQEVFLVVSRPREMTDFCASVLLELAHLMRDEREVLASRVDAVEFRLLADAQGTRGGKLTDQGLIRRKTGRASHTETYNVPVGWEVDTEQGDDEHPGVSVNIIRERGLVDGPVVTITSASVLVSAEVEWSSGDVAKFSGGKLWRFDGYLDADVRVHLKKTERVEITEQMYISARDLCCCPTFGLGDIQPARPPGDWIAYVGAVPKVTIRNELASPTLLRESRTLASAVRDHMIKSVGSSRRYDRGEVTYDRSDLYFGRIARVMIARRLTGALEVPIEKSGLLDYVARGLIHSRLGSIDPARFLRLSAAELSARMDVEESAILELKARMLSELNQMCGHHTAGSSGDETQDNGK